jgi:glycosidase
MTDTDFAPEWARHAVWYQIFPERFCNGDPKNDPTPESMQGAHAGEHRDGWQIHPWTSDWYELQPYEKQHDMEIWRHLARRRYGGDLQGIIDRLDYLQDLGVNALYLTPVFESPSSHKYDAACHHHIDPHFGPDPEGDRRLMAREVIDDPGTWHWTSADRLALSLIHEVHNRGMRIIFDGVFNHVGVNHWAFRDVVKHQRHSRYRDWFKIESWDDHGHGTRFAYRGWAGHSTLPEFRQDEHGIVAGPREYLYAVTRRWMAPEGDTGYGLDGWRLDVAFCVAHGFWKDWRALVKSINPEAYITAELVRPPELVKPYLQGDEFDAEMNYNFAFACEEYLLRETRRISASAFDRLLCELREAHPPCVAPVMQNLFGSHDTARLASFIVNRDKLTYRNWESKDPKQDTRARNPLFDTRAPFEDERRIQKLFVIFQMSYVGAPMIYYGDEAGMWGARDPCCRKPMLWHDMQYDDEVFRPDGSRRSLPDAVAFDWDQFRHYQRLIGIRKHTPALRTGGYRTLLADDARQLFIFARECEEQTVIVALNSAHSTESISVPVERDARWTDVLNDDQVYHSRGGTLTLPLPPVWAAILVRARG